MKKFICLFLLVLIVCSCATPVSAVDSALGMAAPMALNDDMDGYVQVSSLQLSTHYSFPDNMFLFNCYAYVMNETTQRINPGYYSEQSITHSTSVSTIAEIIKDDLLARGETPCVKTQTSSPPAFNINKVIIALRREETSPTNENDYHVARLTSVGWLHKPGNTGILKFNNAPTYNVNWIGECSWPGANNSVLYYTNSNLEYDSTIWYIIGSTVHTAGTNWAYTGNHYHSGQLHWYECNYRCSECGELTGQLGWVSLPCTGSSCILPWSTTPEHEVE